MIFRYEEMSSAGLLDVIMFHHTLSRRPNTDTCYTRTNQPTDLAVIRMLWISQTTSPAVARLGRLYRIYPKACVRLPVGEKKRIPRVSTFQYMLG